MYRFAYRLASRAVEWIPAPPGVFAEARRGRRQSPTRWAAWAASHTGSGPVIWVHAASVGEASAAESVLRRVRERIPTLTVVHSFTSPSAISSPSVFAAAFRDYLPRDQPGTVAAVLGAVKPSILAHVRGDLWPELICAAHARGIPQVVVGGTIRPRSLRLRWPVRSLYAAVLRGVSWLGVVSDPDADRWVHLGADPVTVEVTGDPRHDYLLERSRQPASEGSLSNWARRHRALVAGSVEREDEAIVLDAARQLLTQEPSASIAIVPHDPDPLAVARIMASAHALGLSPERWSPDAPGAPAAGLVVVAARGLLFDLYRPAVAAYVGGGFRPAGLHAVMEPAAHGVPLAIGTRGQVSSDAAVLLEAGGAVGLPHRGAAAALAAVWRRWLRDERARNAAGIAARGTLRAGAAERTGEVVVRLIAGR